MVGAVVMVMKMVKALYVEGKPNEWVLIIRNGKMIKAGVGLSCFSGPMD